jgi:hypothetical protein
VTLVVFAGNSVVAVFGRRCERQRGDYRRLEKKQTSVNKVDVHLQHRGRQQTKIHVFVADVFYPLQLCTITQHTRPPRESS